MEEPRLSRRAQTPSLKVLREAVRNSHQVLSGMVTSSPEDIPGGIPGILKYTKLVKQNKNEFVARSQQLFSILFDNSSIQDSKDIRAERHTLLHEVSEFINLTNDLLKNEQVDQVSNIEVYSIMSSEKDVSSQTGETPDENFVIDKKQNINDIGNGLSTASPADIEHFNEVFSTPNNKSVHFKPHNSVSAVYMENKLKHSENIDIASNAISVNSSTAGFNTESQFFLQSNFHSNGVNAENKISCVPSDYEVYNSISRNNNSTKLSTAPIYSPSHSHPIQTQMASGFPVNSSSFIQHPNTIQNNFVHSIQTGHQQSNIPTALNRPNPLFPPTQVNTQPMQVLNSNEVLMNYIATQDITKNSIQKFDGTAFKFWAWVEQIKSRIKHLRLDPVDVLHILQSNCTGAPNKMISNYLASSGNIDQSVLDEVWSVLVERFGSQGSIAEQLLNQLKDFPVLGEKNIGEKLQEFHDICKIASFNMSKSAELQILNCSGGLKPLREKLPKFLQDRWRREGQTYEDNNYVSHPPFDFFVLFLKKSAREMSNKNYENSSVPVPDRDRRYNKVMATQIIESDAPPKHNSKPDNCPIHNSSFHRLVNCRSFLRMSISEKRAKLSELHLCWRCMGNHFRNKCLVEVKCEVCNGPHHTAFHIYKRAGYNNDDSSSGRAPTPYQHSSPAATSQDSRTNHSLCLCTQVCGSSVTKPLNCSKTMPVYLSSSNNKSVLLKCYAIIDEHSNCTLVDPKVPKILGAHSEQHDYLVSTVGGCETISSGHMVKGLMVRGVGKDEWIDLPDSYTNDHIPNTVDEVATRKVVEAHNSIKRFSHHFGDVEIDGEVLILIGRDCGKAMGTQCYGTQEPWVHDTPLGWALVGNTCTDRKSSISDKKHVLKSVITHEHLEVKNIFNKKMSNDFPVFKEYPDDEELGFSVKENAFLDKMNNEVIICSTGHLEAPVPLSNDDPLPSNQSAVYHRSKNTLQRLKLKPDAINACVVAMGKSLSAGYIEEVPHCELKGPEGRCWYLPIFPVYHPKKNKVRLVYDASAKYGGTSLNQNLLTGPDLNHELRGVLQRFREEKIAIIGDIESMFNNFKVSPKDRDLLRFFWFKDNQPDNDIVQYRAIGHIFGCTSSPGVAAYCMRRAALLPSAEPYEKGREFIQNSFYVDDGISSVGTVEEAITVIKEASEILKFCNIRLHKILSNSWEVLAALPESERAEGCHLLDYDEIPSHRTLGVYWEPIKDVFKVQVTLPERPFTKRGILAVINSLYDPIGMIAPISLAGRLIQRLVLPRKEELTEELEKCGWDDALPEKYVELWESWKHTLLELELVELSRCLIPKHFINPQRELHVFSDASEKAIGHVIYLKSIYSSEINITFVTGSAKVAPRSAVTMPRLELNAAVDGVQAAARLIAELSIKPDNVTYYTDSMILLGYICNHDKRFSKYVSRRVHIIQKLTNSKNWKYVSTAENPADLASRSCKPEELSASNWFTGPQFLWSPQITDDIPKLPDALPEQVIDVATLHNTVCELSLTYKLSTNVSSWSKIINVTKLVMSMLNRLDVVRQRNGVSLAPRSPHVNNAQATKQLILHMQNDSFKPLIDLLKNQKTVPDSDKISQLSPFLDSHSIIRVGGRLKSTNVPYDVKHPILVRQDHPLTERLVDHFHTRVGHQGRHITHGEVRRSGYHVLGGKQFINKFISRCVLCRKLRGALEGQLMADLPMDRVEEIPVFSNCGLDIFGHFNIFDRKTTRSNVGSRKIWVLIFVCLTSRAIHLEVLPFMDTSSFRNALQRFICMRGTPKLIRSDNGSNIVSTKSQIMESVSITEVQDQLEKKGIEWLFNPPHASHFGGVYERKIGSVRRVLEGCMTLLGPRRLTYDEFSTLLQEAGSIVNNTPLCEVSDHPDDPMPITPAALLTLRESDDHPALEQFDSKELLSYGTQRWRRCQFLAQEFWLRWRRDYLDDLNKRHKWKTRQPCITIGDVVMLREKSLKRNHWPIARVSDVKKGKDGLVRVVTIVVPPLKGSLKNRTFIRSIHDLVLLVKAPSHSDCCINYASD